ncbi:phosphate ABC transporter permease PstA [Nocardioides sp. GY 10127]|uniref:phosphate ABC transporter permease PstA n=1 Tax=Nocardioides sp. GY 10127 TaxID=2569762 RepID=UPI0010A7A52C|nr:phosphate ABC transporter permease PstA [Nocardioides sp. GY 10127]TIC84364.1 phosphate ABC transporter permease PstA [Nocardioides sp. GY 10127]
MTTLPAPPRASEADAATAHQPAAHQAGTHQPGTHLPQADPDAPPATPLATLGRPTADELFRRYGAWVAAAGLAYLLTQQVLPLPGVPWFLITFFCFGLLTTAVLAATDGGWIEVKNRVVEATVTGGALVVGLALVSTLGFILLQGWRPLLHLNFFTQDMSGVGWASELDQGGILHAIVGSLIELSIALVVTLPLGIGTAVFMTEVGGRFARLVRTVVEAMTALPSIVAGLFVYTVWILTLGMPQSGLAAGLAISVMMLPIIARAADVVLRVVPGNLREASLALGASRWKTVWHVVLPTARPGLATAVILGVARGVGETSPVLLTSGASDYLNVHPTQNTMNSLPLFIFKLVLSGEPNAVLRAYGAATVLLLLVLALFVVARVAARPRKGTSVAARVRGLVRPRRRTAATPDTTPGTTPASTPGTTHPDTPSEETR